MVNSFGLPSTIKGLEEDILLELQFSPQNSERYSHRNANSYLSEIGTCNWLSSLRAPPKTLGEQIKLEGMLLMGAIAGHCSGSI